MTYPPVPAATQRSGASQVALSYGATGVTGATAGARLAGATASGAPASGTFAAGDFVVDQSGLIWICTASGSPGTWTGVAVQGGGAGGGPGTAGLGLAIQSIPASLISLAINSAAEFLYMILATADVTKTITKIVCSSRPASPPGPGSTGWGSTPRPGRSSASPAT